VAVSTHQLGKSSNSAFFHLFHFPPPPPCVALAPCPLLLAIPAGITTPIHGVIHTTCHLLPHSANWGDPPQIILTLLSIHSVCPLDTTNLAGNP
jgi:hypothetical protein